VLTLKAPVSMKVDVKAARGFVNDAVSVKPGRFDRRVWRYVEFVTLKPGEETPVPVLVPDLPANGDVKSITAHLDVADDTDAPPPQPTSVTIKQGSSPPLTMEVTPGIPTRPRNVTVRLEEGEPIWSFGDTLVNNRYELADFAAQANAYLDKVNPADTQVTLNFLVKSDTPGKVNIAIGPKTVTRLQTQTWTNELDQTVRLDRNLELDFGDRWEITLHAVEASGPPPLERLRLDVGGAFGAERLLGAIRVHAGGQYATVSPDYSIAQQFSLDIGVEAAGVSGLLGVDDDAEVYVELQPDQAGVPAADAPLARATAAIVASEDGSASWVYAQFESPARLEAGTPYWIVVKGVSGAARLGIEAPVVHYLNALLVNRTGRLWKPFAPSTRDALASMLRVVYLPGIDSQSAAVEIAVAGADEQAVDPQAAPSTLSFVFKERSASPVVIEVTSHARGALTIANIIQEY
jgi:hypothetical protein